MGESRSKNLLAGRCNARAGVAISTNAPTRDVRRATETGERSDGMLDYEMRDARRQRDRETGFVVITGNISWQPTGKGHTVRRLGRSARFLFFPRQASCRGLAGNQEREAMNLRTSLAWMVMGAVCVLLTGPDSLAQPPRDAGAKPAPGPGGGPGPGGWPGGPGAFGGPGGFGGFGGPGFFGGFGELSELLRRQDVRHELELLDEQVAKLEKLAEERRTSMREMFQGIQDIPMERRGDEFRERARKARQDLEDDIGKILLPHQMRRAKQLVTQLQMRGMRGLLNGPVAQDLELTAAQKEQLQARSAELEEQIRKKMAELRTQSQAELMRLLTPAQQAKWKEMVGEPFEFQRDEPPRRPIGPAVPDGAGGPDRPRQRTR